MLRLRFLRYLPAILTTPVFFRASAFQRANTTRNPRTPLRCSLKHPPNPSRHLSSSGNRNLCFSDKDLLWRARAQFSESSLGSAELYRPLQKEVTDTEEKLARLYRLVEDGLTDVDEVLRDRLDSLKAQRERAKAALERAKELSAPQIRVGPELIERFGRTMQENFTTGSVPFRKAYLQALIERIEVDDRVVRIRGNKDLLEQVVLASQRGQSWCSQMSTKWRARRDSNS